MACSLATLVPHSRYFEEVDVLFQDDDILRVSRFAYVRYETELVISSPRGHAHLVVSSADALLVYHRLCDGMSLASLKASLAGIPAEELVELVRMMMVCRIVERVAEPPALRQWEFHDLLVQAESRMGRCSRPVGGTHRFAGALEVPPAVKPIPWEKAVPLRVPPPDAPYGQITLEQALTTRTSSRKQGTAPITLAELGDFLHRTARILSRESTPWPREYPFGGEYTRRPYPNGGARYELELYLTVDRCEGLDRGFYYYDALDHRLVLVAEPVREMEQMLVMSTLASGGCRTQVLVTIASRFQRSSWKYQGLAMALQLKNVGVLFAHLYLVAAAMGLACCALGAGDSDLFSKVSGLDYLEESSIGEFQLGSRYVDEPG